MTQATMTEEWRSWSAEDKLRQPRRVCSTAGCKGTPARVKVTTTEREDGTAVVRKHVYCAKHAPAK